MQVGRSPARGAAQKLVVPAKGGHGKTDPKRKQGLNVLAQRRYRERKKASKP